MGLEGFVIPFTFFLLACIGDGKARWQFFFPFLSISFRLSASYAVRRIFACFDSSDEEEILVLFLGHWDAVS